MKKIIIVVLCALGVGAAGAYKYWEWSTSPTRSMNLLIKAFKEHDTEAVDRYMDTNEVFSDLFSQFKSLIGGKWGDNLVPKYIGNHPEPATHTLYKFILTGDIYYVRNYENDSGVAEQTIKVLDNLKILGIDSEIKTGKVATLTIGVKLRNDVEGTVKVRMKNEQSVWRVFEVQNLGELIAKNTGLSKQK